MTQHLTDIAAYIDAVVTGKRPACKWERLAVERHLKDLDRQGDADFPYVFDEAEGQRIINFGELFPHVKGKWAAQVGKENRIKLEPWQKFNFAMIFGWVHKDTGFRRFRIVYLCVPRKNAKSVKAAIIGLYMMVEDSEYGAEVYCGATTEKQAWEVFRPAKKMAEKQPAFRRQYGVNAHAKRMEADVYGAKRLRNGEQRRPDGSRFEPVIGKPGDGASPSCAILDEVHEHQDDVLYDTMLTGMGAREQPLLLMITTAGSNIAGPCYASQKEVERMLEGEKNDTLYGMIYTIDDPENEWMTEEGLIKANPNIGISVFRDYLFDQVERAKRSPRKRSTVLTKHFNVWVTAKNAWLNMLDWAAAGDQTLSPDDFIGETATLGLDLSESDDLTAAVKCFTRNIDGLPHYYFFGRYYTTEAKVVEHDHYDGWINEGYLYACAGNHIDTEDVEEDIEADTELYSMPQAFYDPHGAADLAQRLAKYHEFEAVKVQQNYSNYSAPMRDFERLLKAGRIHHDGNPCLTWMFGNVVAQTSRDGKMMRPIKESKDTKIDGAVAALMAFIAAYQPEDDDGDLEDFLLDPIIV
ncbi:terminase large subunit [Aestuariicella hydrocarbonica]|uniref:Terminase large subunit n=1 Tax=Pseudomaricurvus hydrocarbonicus TaxID=1470433 RepID=A0A9E5JQ83_9GAMM|nr:terminase TerL endonuclease subunit [Aestuariicella hydrocarbonica]NHO64632.1 terminase large subunit [Aestuariicella hydrocarbonica]